MNGLTETKNYTFSAQIWKPDQESFNRNRDRIEGVMRAATNVKNSISWVVRKWNRVYVEHMRPLCEELKAAKESISDKAQLAAVKKDIAARMKNKVSEFYSTHNSQIKLDAKSSTAWYEDHWAFSNYIKTDMESRVKLDVSKKPKHCDPYEGGDICIQIPGGIDSKSINKSTTAAGFRMSLLREHKKRKVIRIKIAGKRGSDPVYVDLNIKFHRDLPDGVIKYVRIRSERFGCKMKYWVTFTVETPVDEEDLSTVKFDKWAGVKIGWAEDSGVATAVEYSGSDGVVSGFSVDIAESAELSAQIDKLKAKIDKELVPEKRAIIASADKSDWPEWLVKKCTHAYQWRSPYRILNCEMELRKVGLTVVSIKDLRAAVIKKRKLERKLSNKRKIKAEAIAVELSRKYDAVGVPNTNYKSLKERDSEDKHVKDELSRNKMTAVSPGIIRDRILSKFGMRAFVVDIKQKSLGDDTLMFMHASTEVLAKGSGVLANVEKAMKSLEKKAERSSRMTNGRLRKKLENSRSQGAVDQQ